ncbi:MAG: glutathione S-transferase family protein [Gammaproteobacteria bacterium]|nr:glutathione S-transferase family protein [Gammaproteobacteria bacterium]
MKLYDSTLAPNPRRTRIFLAEKGVEYEKVDFNIPKGDNLDPEFLKVNPRGLLPTLVLDDGTVLDESVAICRYFEESIPEPNLMGTDAKSKALIEARQRHMEFDGLMGAAEAFRNSYPGFANRGLGGSVGEVPAIPELAERGKASVTRFFDRLDEYLGDNAYCAGDSFSIADITAFCAVDFATTAARIAFPDDKPNLKRWYDEISARPSASA